MKTTILIISLLAVLLFAAINNSSNSVSAINRSEVKGNSSLSNNINPNNNINASGNSTMSNNSNYSGYSYVSGNSNQTDNTNLTDATFRTEDSIYSDETDNLGDTITFQTIQNKLSSDGEFVTINSDEIDPENISGGSDGTMDDDIYTDRIWVPRANYDEVGWNPYTNGIWVWTVCGWNWVSDYRWGMTYHYGRWWFSPIYGWVWSPGRRWAPSWVFWSHHRDYDGWYPLSPRIHHRHWNYTEGNNHFNHNHWVFVKSNDFTKHVTVSTVMPYQKNKNILVNSIQSMTLKDNGKKIYNSGPDIKSTGTVAVKKTDLKPINKVVTKDIKNENIKKVPVTKTDTKLKPVDLMKKTEMNNKKAENNKIKEIVPVIDTKKKVIENTSGIDKKVNTISVNTKSNIYNNKTNDNKKTVIKTENSNITTIKIGNSNQTNLKNTNMENTNVRNTNNNINNNNTIRTETRNTSTNNSNVNNRNTNNTEVKIRNANNTGIKTDNTIKTENSSKRVDLAPKTNPVPKENPSQMNLNNKKGS